MNKTTKYKTVKKAGKFYREHFEPSAFNGAPAVVDKAVSKITEPLFNKASYAIVGALGYRSKSNPARGSFVYTMVHTALKSSTNFIIKSPSLIFGNKSVSRVKNPKKRRI